MVDLRFDLTFNLIAMLWGAGIGVGITLFLTLIHGVIADVFSFGGLGSIGEKLTLPSFLNNVWKPALIFGVAGAVVGLLIDIVI